MNGFSASCSAAIRFCPTLCNRAGRRCFHEAASYIVETFSLSLAAWIGSIPLAAYYFHLFTPVSVPANCVVVPATALALISGMGSLLTGAWWPGLAALFNNADLGLDEIHPLVQPLGRGWPDGNFNAAAPSRPPAPSTTRRFL